MMSDFAILYDPAAFSFSDKVMGRQSAGLAFLKAVADTNPARIFCYSATRANAQILARAISSLGSPRTGIAWVPLDQPEHLSDAGILYRADPGIGSHAWHRLSRSNPRAYSLCGITHTISSHGPMSAFAEYLTAPVESWDAVICTSRAARDALRHVLEAQAEHLSSRIGATRFTLPQLPLIPLGVHTAQFRPSAVARGSARQRLAIADDEVAILFAGRLAAHVKAHPIAMYLSLEKISHGRKIVLIQAGQAPNEDILKIFVDEPRRFCPSVRVIMVDGRNEDMYRATWAAADIFTSLSDSFQETFGLTPIEAMASGLPVVVSDWNGYKDTVRHGIDGFRVPTLTINGDTERDLALRYDLGIDNFDYYSAFSSQLVAVDINAAAEAYRILIDDKELRTRMGSAGAKRVRETYDWSVIFRSYQTLWEELSERRRADPQLVKPSMRHQRPDRANPFSVFASYPTYCIGWSTTFRRRNGINALEAVSRGELASTSFAKPVLPTPSLVEAILNTIDTDWTPFDGIVRAIPDTPSQAVASALVWLSKVGVLDFQAAR